MIFTDETYSKQPMRIYPTNKIIYIHIKQIWSIDLADMIGYEISNNKGFTYIFVIVDNFSKFVWAIPLKNKNGRIVAGAFSKNLSTSKRSTLKLESDRGSEWYNSISQKFLKSMKIQHYSRLTDNGPTIAERVNRTIRNLSKKPVFGKGNADWLSELPYVIKQ